MSNITLGITQCSNVSDPPDPDFVFGPETLAAGSRWFSVGICKYKPGYKSHDLL